ncbi:MAG TPA: nucleotidyltransferase domain-containing protein [Noviherbaspirillum sp.]
MQSAMTNGLPESIARQVSRTRLSLKHHFGDAIQSIYLFGSTVDGGLKPSSDIDLLVTVNAPLADATRALPPTSSSMRFRLPMSSDRFSIP